MFKTKLLRPKVQQGKPWLMLQQPEITSSSARDRPGIAKGNKRRDWTCSMRERGGQTPGPDPAPEKAHEASDVNTKQQQDSAIRQGLAEG